MSSRFHSKRAPPPAHTVPKLEFNTAVLVVEMSKLITDEMDIEILQMLNGSDITHTARLLMDTYTTTLKGSINTLQSA